MTAFYTLLIAFLMVSRLPVFSGKTIGTRVPPEMVLPVFVSVVLFIALLISYPWVRALRRLVALSVGLPIGWKSYREQDLKAAVQETFPDAPSPRSSLASLVIRRGRLAHHSGPAAQARQSVSPSALRNPAESSRQPGHCALERKYSVNR